MKKMYAYVFANLHDIFFAFKTEGFTSNAERNDREFIDPTAVNLRYKLRSL